MIFDLIGVERAVEIDEQRIRPKASEVDRLCADSMLLQQLTGWRPKVTSREGLTLTIDWSRPSELVFDWQLQHLMMLQDSYHGFWWTISQRGLRLSPMQQPYPLCRIR